MDNSVSKIKQPAPSVSSLTAEAIDEQGNRYKVIKAQNVGVIKLPKITTTPLTDWVELKKKENPYTIYKPKYKNQSIMGFQTFASLSVIACSILSLIKLFKK